MNAAQILTIARDELTPKQFEAWELYYRAGWSYGKIAMQLNVDRSTAQRRVERAQTKLHHELAKREDAA